MHLPPCMCAPAGWCPWWMTLTGCLTPNRLHIHPRHPSIWWTQQVEPWRNQRGVKDTSLIHSHVFLNCSFGYSKVRADVTGHCLCTNYVWDSCERRGPHQRTHLQLQEGNEWIPSADANTEILHKPVLHQGFSLMEKMINIVSIIIINTKIFPGWLKGNTCKWFNI